jgi:hypothetical protein
VPHEIEALAIGEPHVGEAQVEALLLQALLRLGDRGRRGHGEPHLDQRELEQLADIGLVVDHQHLRAALRRASFGALHDPGALRATTRKCAPAPAWTYSSSARLAAHSSRAR